MLAPPPSMFVGGGGGRTISGFQSNSMPPGMAMQWQGMQGPNGWVGPPVIIQYVEKDRDQERLRHKTKMCKQWTANGKCSYEHTCNFAHGEHELRILDGPPAAKRHSASGGSSRTNSRGSSPATVSKTPGGAAGAAATAARAHLKHKTQACRNFPNCPKGTACTYLHPGDAMGGGTRPQAQTTSGSSFATPGLTTLPPAGATLPAEGELVTESVQTVQESVRTTQTPAATDGGGNADEVDIGVPTIEITAAEIVDNTPATTAGGSSTVGDSGTHSASSSTSTSPLTT